MRTQTQRSTEKDVVIRVKLIDGQVEEFRSDLPAIRIGRAANNDLVVADPYISRYHAILFNRGDGQTEIVGLSGPGAIIQKGQKLQRTVLKGDEEIILGKTLLKVVCNQTEATEERVEPKVQLATSISKIDVAPDPMFAPAPRAIVEPTDPGQEEPIEVADPTYREPLDLDEDEDPDDWPAYSLGESLLKEKPDSGARGEEVWEIVRFNRDVAFESIQLRSGEKLRSPEDGSVLFKVSRNGDLQISRRAGFQVEAKPGSNDFAPAEDRLVYENRSWLAAHQGPLTLRQDELGFRCRQQVASPIFIRPEKTEVEPVNIHIAGYSALVHFALIAILSVLNLNFSVNASQLPEDDLKRFVEISLQDLEKPEPKKITTPKPKPKPKKVVKKRKPTPRKRVTVAKRIPKPRPKPKLDVSQIGALGKLGRGAFAKKASSSKLIAAASNLDAVRAYGGAQTFRVSGNIQAMKGKDVRLARISHVKTRGGSPLGDGFGNTSVGRKSSQKVQGSIVKLDPPPMEVSIKGGLTREEIARVVQQHVSAIRYCYEKSLLENPSLAGKILMKWTIASRGSVSQSGIGSSSVRSSQVHRCLVREVRTWQFPNPRGGGVVLVSYPFVFDNAAF